MKYELSKTLMGNEIVALRGNKFIRAHKYSKPRGVFTRGGISRTMLLSGENITTEFPMGIIFYGLADIKATI